jgi:hypothetical protein
MSTSMIFILSYVSIDYPEINEIVNNLQTAFPEHLYLTISTQAKYLKKVLIIDR